MEPDTLFGALDGGKGELECQYLEMLAAEGWSTDSMNGSAGERKRSWEVVFEGGADCGTSGNRGGGKSVKDAKNKASREKARRERINDR